MSSLPSISPMNPMKMSFRNRMLFTISGACFVCTAAAIFISASKLEANGRAALVEKSQAILSRLEVGAGYVARMGTLESVIQETIKKFPEGNISDSQRQKILNSVPIFAAMQIGEKGAQLEHYEFRIASDSHRRNQNKASDSELILIERFRKDPSLKEWVETSPDGKFIRVSRPVRLSEEKGCLTCHGHPSRSPWGNGKDILGYPMEDFKDGYLKGTFTIISSLGPVEEAVKTSTRDLSLWGIFITLSALFLGFMTIRRSINGIDIIAGDLSKAAAEVASMSTEIATTSDQLSSGVIEQAAALQETTVSMDGVKAMVSRNSSNAEQSTKTANESQNTAEKGKEVVESMIRSIEEIDHSNSQIMAQIEESNRQIGEIVKVISDIGEKTKVINDIVFQTKLLSFNASVEAARAGEHGMGFSVVAEEVGNLAQMSGNAAAEISGMLEGSIHKVEKIVNDTKTRVEALTKEGKGKVEAGTRIARRCGESLAEIVAGAQSVSQMVMEISMGSQEQERGIEEISRAVVQLDQITQQNSSASQSSASAASRLSKQADFLRESVQSLMATLNGQDARSNRK